MLKETKRNGRRVQREGLTNGGRDRGKERMEERLMK